MKRVLTLIMLSMITSSAFAGWSTVYKNKCNWLTNRYKSLARISIGLPICLQQNASCGGNYQWSLHPTCSKNCGFQEAWSGPGGMGSYGYISQNICARGEMISDFDAALLPDPGDDGTVTGNIEESKTVIEEVIFDDVTHSVIINNFSGDIMLQKGNGFMSKARVTIWLPTDDVAAGVEDETIEDNEVVSQLSITLTDGGVVIDGAMANDFLPNLVKTEDGQKASAQFNGVNLVIPIPAHINMADLAVVLDGDGAPDNGGNLQRTVQTTSSSIETKQIAFNCYPNPATTQFNIEFINNENDAQTSIALYDVTGKMVKELYKGQVKKGELLPLSVDMSAYSSQNYFVLINSGGKQFVKQFSKQ